MATGLTLSGRYELRTRLGAGGAGAVWRGFDTTLQREVAIKLISLDGPGLGVDIDAPISRFRREARAVAQLNHPNIVAAYDFGVHEDVAFLVMELVEGASLAEHLRRRHAAGLGGFEELQVIHIARQVCAGLAVAHRARLVHRDMKPSNLMVADANGRVKIVDFGIARIEEQSRLTRTGSYLGTLPYVAPEQMDADPIDGRADLYSLACVLFELMTGRSPYEASTPMQWMSAHQKAAPVPLRRFAPAASPDMEALLQRMLSKNPNYRPPNADAVSEALAQVGAKLTMHGPRYGVGPGPGPVAGTRGVAQAPRVPRGAAVPPGGSSGRFPARPVSGDPPPRPPGFTVPAGNGLPPLPGSGMPPAGGPHGVGGSPVGGVPGSRAGGVAPGWPGPAVGGASARVGGVAPVVPRPGGLPTGGVGTEISDMAEEGKSPDAPDPVSLSDAASAAGPDSVDRVDVVAADVSEPASRSALAPSARVGAPDDHDELDDLAVSGEHSALETLAAFGITPVRSSPGADVRAPRTDTASVSGGYVGTSAVFTGSVATAPADGDALSPAPAVSVGAHAATDIDDSRSGAADFPAGGEARDATGVETPDPAAPELAAGTAGPAASLATLSPGAATATPSTVIPAPVIPAPAIPAPAIPAPAIPASTIPASTIPASTIPASTIPAPTIPAPTIPAPTIPASTTPPTATPSATAAAAVADSPATPPVNLSATAGHDGPTDDDIASDVSGPTVPLLRSKTHPGVAPRQVGPGRQPAGAGRHSRPTAPVPPAVPVAPTMRRGQRPPGPVGPPEIPAVTGGDPAPTRARRLGRNVAVVAIVVAAIVLVASVVAALSHPRERHVGAPVAPGGPLVPAVGDCYAAGWAAAIDTDAASVWAASGDVRPVDCAGTHAFEVVATGTFDVAEAPVATSEAVRETYGKCARAADDYLGGAWRGAYAWLGVAVPDGDAWGRGARWAACVLRPTANWQGAGISATGRLKDGLRGAKPAAITCFQSATGVPTDCAQPHSDEVVGLSTRPPGRWPGTAALYNAYGDSCQAIAAHFLGFLAVKAWTSDALGWQWWSPSQEQWELGNRTAVCTVNTLRKSGMVGTVRNLRNGTPKG